jgi:hypothetical protein
LNQGKNLNLTPSDILDFLMSSVRISPKEIKDIAILSTFSFFSVDERYANEIMNNCKNKKIKGKRTIISLSKKGRR